VAVANGDDPRLRSRLARAGAKQLTFGKSPGCDLVVAARTVDAGGASTVVLRTRGRSFAALGGSPREIRVPTSLLGETAAMNIAAALAGAIALLDRAASPEELSRLTAAIAAVEPVAGRLRPMEAGGVLVLDDSYNSNPRSVRAALLAARELAQRRETRLVVALGDMLELGEVSSSEHLAMVEAADRCGADQLILVGAATAEAAATLPGGLSTPAALFADSTSAAADLRNLAAEGDLLLVKGSRGVRMERLIEALEVGPPVGLH
jgi:UDP-N-acetylmuramoyl-tripeptide--D-alanyl-D-alanine ligase